VVLVTSAEKPRLIFGSIWYDNTSALAEVELVYFHAGDKNLLGAVSAFKTKEHNYELCRTLHRFSEPVNHIKTAPVLGGSRGFGGGVSNFQDRGRHLYEYEVTSHSSHVTFCHTNTRRISHNRTGCFSLNTGSQLRLQHRLCLSLKVTTANEL
jgi:hypothetical protein